MGPQGKTFSTSFPRSQPPPRRSPEDSLCAMSSCVATILSKYKTRIADDLRIILSLPVRHIFVQGIN